MRGYLIQIFLKQRIVQLCPVRLGGMILPGRSSLIPVYLCQTGDPSWVDRWGPLSWYRSRLGRRTRILGRALTHARLSCDLGGFHRP